MTRLEQVIYENEKFKALGKDADRTEKQKVLDEITADVLEQVTPEELCAHTTEIYNDTVVDYSTNPLHKSVIDDLAALLCDIPDGSRILDIGCGTGRDVLFMAISDPGYRKSKMQRKSLNGKTTLERLGYIPAREFKAIGIDGTQGMIDTAKKERTRLFREGLLEDTSSAIFEVMDMHKLGNIQHGPFDLIWSCAALFTHTPKAFIEPTLMSISGLLVDGGLFFTSYTNGAIDERYNKLLASSTGRIKYFSQPYPNDISVPAIPHSLELLFENKQDMVFNGKVTKKDLFVNQLFQKKG